MSYFNHAFRKSYVGTKATVGGSGTQTAVNNGLVIESGIHTSALSNTASPNTLGVGTYAFVDPKTYESVVVGDAQVTDGRPLILAGSSLFTDDKIGPFHGGYKESNKSKMINPRYVSKWSKMTGSAAEQAISHFGNTNYNANGVATVGAITAGGGYTNGTYSDIPFTGGTGVGFTADVTVAGGVVTVVTVVTGGQGYTVADVLTVGAGVPYTPGTPASVPVATLQYDEGSVCTAIDFICGETYNLRVDLWGSPVLRFLNHDLYKTFAAYTGCCPAGTVVPGNVDSTLVMINWANQIINDVWAQHFISPIVYTEQGIPLFATAALAIAAGYSGTDNVWTTYVSPGHTTGAMAGIRIEGAYVDTPFGNCSFQCSDFFEKEVVQMNLSMTDLTGDPCEFSAVCTTQESAGFTGQGYGETVLRDVILDESYLQNHFSYDQRIREITQGDQYFAAVPRAAFYTRYVLQHSVPRFNNPSGVFDNDQYCLNIYTTAATATALEALVTAWLNAALGTGVVALETFGHTAYVPEAL